MSSFLSGTELRQTASCVCSLPADLSDLSDLSDCACVWLFRLMALFALSACVANWITESADHNRHVPHGRQNAIGTEFRLWSKNSLTCLFQIPSGPPLIFTVNCHLIFTSKLPETNLPKSLSIEIKFHAGFNEHIAGGSDA